MTPAKQKVQAALKLHQEGKVAEAERAYRAIVAADPGNFLSTYNLGILLVQQGRAQDGEPFLAEATRLNPDFLAAQVVHGGVLSQLGRMTESLAVFDKILARDPNHRDALNDRANALIRMNRLDEAMQCLDRLLSLAPQSPIAHYNRASILATLGRTEEALAALEIACAAKPGFAEALFFKGNLLRTLKQPAAALAAYEAAVAANPRHADALNNTGDTLSEMGRHGDALAVFERALTIAPTHIDLLVNRGRALGKLGRTEEQFAAFEQALAIKPDYAPALLSAGVALTSLRRYDQALEKLDRAVAAAPTDPRVLEARGSVLTMLGRKEEAVASYEASLGIAPSVEALNNYGHLLRRMSRYEEAAAAYERVIALKPDLPMAKGFLWTSRLYCCDWADPIRAIDAMVADTLAGKAVTNPFALVQFSSSAEAQLRCAEMYIASKKRTPAAWAPGARTGDRLRVAYLSSDLQNHATAFLMAGMFEAHDRTRFETIAISFARDDNTPYRQRLRSAFDRFIDASFMTDEEVSHLVRGLNVDIAVDLKGFTSDARPDIFLDRIAPLQVSFVGYPGTWGAACMDYLVADPVIIPPGAERFYAEKIVRMPDSYQPNDRNRVIAAHVPTCAELGLPEQGFVFCSFNNCYKILPPVFDVWMRLLKQIPDSVLWLLATNTAAVRNLRNEAAARGVAPERLIFAPVAQTPAHLARQARADLFLDTLPCNAHTTASDALWAGLPVLTCLGETFAGRVAASLVTAAGLPDLVTSDLAAYESRALELASTPEKLHALRDRLAQNRLTCALFDTEKFCRHLEAAYRAMWDRQRAGQPPAHIDVASL
ncbi:MAG: tetratricopeptide repeat protein [Rhodospirillaceae bacterium]|nr:tetratricopeptide repeat protein [Rhodospirillaceae bacterium]